jgi:D-alanine-D-alanine ligase
MRVGLAYDLRSEYEALGLSGEAIAEFDSEGTIEALEGAIRSLGYATDRIGSIRALAARLADGEHWDLVFNITEGLTGRSREAQVPALLEAFGLPYTFSDPLVMAATLDKAVAKRLVRDEGVPTAPFALVRRVAEADAVDLPFPLFAKPVAEGTGKGVSPRSKVGSRAELRSICAELIARYAQPVLVETYLPGRELTVGILGTGEGAWVLGSLEIELLAGAEPEVYSYLNKERCEELVRYRLVRDATAVEAQRVALRAYRALGMADAGRIDLRCDGSGAPLFLEANALPGLHPTHSDLPILATQAGIGYRELIGTIMEAAFTRQGVSGAVMRAAE